MPIEFDPAKAADNVRKHGVSFADAEVLVVVWADRGGRHRLISARHATRKERTAYET